MRVLQAHNYYQQAGGEDTVVANERSLLASRGQVVHEFSVSNDAIDGTRAKVRTAWRVSYSRDARRRMGEAIRQFAPDVVHVHNFFPILTPSIYDACRDANVPVVQTLHNYRTICAAATLMRRGRPCEDCVNGSSYPAVLHRCYRGSVLGSLAVAQMIQTHHRRRTWQEKVDKFIALSEFAKNKFIQAKFSAGKIVVKPNFVEDRRIGATERAAREGALFVGRLSAEKGIHTLLKAWLSIDTPLRVIGDGPLFDAATRARVPGVNILGRKAPDEVAAEMQRAAFLVMPSEWYEGFPLTLAEAFCQGLPVIGSRLGATAEIVDDGVTGLHFLPGDAEHLAVKVRWAVDHAEEMRQMGANARRIYEAKYTPEVNYRQLMAIYKQTIFGQ